MTLDDVLREPDLVPIARRWFFERLTAGLLDPEEARALAAQLDLELEASAYALALLDLPAEPRQAAAFFTDPAGEVRGRLLGFFLKYSEYTPFLLGPTLCAVLVKGDGRRLPGLLQRCADRAAAEYGRRGMTGWHAALSSPVERLEQLPDCWEEVSRLWAWRYIRPEQNVFLPGGEAGQPPALPSAPEETALEETAGTYTGALGRAAAYVQEHYARPELTLDETARAAGLTPGYLSALFRQKGGTTFTRYLTELRMAEAKRLLRTTRMPVGQAARACGFRDRRYFSVLFRRTQGCTPTQYRAEYKE